MISISHCVLSIVATFHLYSQSVRYSRAYGSYQDFHDKWLLLTRKVMNQRFPVASWSHHFESFTVDTMKWLTITEYLHHKWRQICSVWSHHNLVLCSFMTYHWVHNNNNTMGATCGTGTAYPPGAPEFTTGFPWCSCCSNFSFLYNVL